MKNSNYTEEQIAFALKQTELGTPLSEVCRMLRTAEQTFTVVKTNKGGWCQAGKIDFDNS